MLRYCVHRANRSRPRRSELLAGCALIVVAAAAVAGCSALNSVSPPGPASASSPGPTAGSQPGLGTAAAAVLADINEARAKAGLRPYAILAGLETSSARHNQQMAAGCGLSHQCAGEPSPADRETAAGVRWTAAGENIGEGGPVADATAEITQMAVALTNEMLAEKPPDDGHRLNILSSSFSHIGIAVYRNGNGTVWLTQDFSN